MTSGSVDLAAQPCQQGHSFLFVCFVLCCVVFLIFLFTVNDINFVPRLALLLLIRWLQVLIGPSWGESYAVPTFQIATGHMFTLW